MERLGHAGHIIADIRIGADRLLEALFVSASHPHRSDKFLNLILEEDAYMRQLLQDLRAVGRKLEEMGVLTESIRSRSNSWGVHMPLVCPDAAVVAYAWKHQLAGQAGSSAVDRSRLALKAFTDQKRRFFPHLDDGLNDQTVGCQSALKKHFGFHASTLSQPEEISDCTTLSDILMHLEKDAPTLKISTYQRVVEWCH